MQTDQFQLIDSQYEHSESSHVKQAINYTVTIKPTKTEVDLNFMENQFYQFTVEKKGEPYCTIERRFSQFQLVFEILSKKQPGFIFPAFPQNGIFAFMKSKVSLSKDQQFIVRRIKIIQRFFNIILNNPLFDPECCKELKMFLSTGKEFEARKQIEKGGKGLFNLSWNKLKTYFTFSKENKYTEAERELETLYAKCRLLIDCLRQQQFQSNKFLTLSLSVDRLKDYIKLLEKHDEQQAFNLHQLQSLQFSLFCQNEDLQMVTRIFTRINELKDDEDNYAELQNIEQNLEDKLQKFLVEKIKVRSNSEGKIKQLIEEIKKVGRVAN